MDPSLEPKSAALRQALNLILELKPDVAQHPELVNHLRSVHAHSIEVAVDPGVNHLPLDRYNCYAYALGLAESASVACISQVFDRSTWLNGEFIEYLLGGYLNEVASNDVHDGDILIYSNEQEIVHMGVAAGGFVVSKWGIGQLWSHGAWEVPLKYGERIRLTRQIDPLRSEEAFVIYAKEREGVDLVEELLEGRQ